MRGKIFTEKNDVHYEDVYIIFQGKLIQVDLYEINSSEDIPNKLIKYEAKHFPIPTPDDPVEVLQFYMASRGPSRSDLISYLGSKERVSEILSGKRRLSLAMILSSRNSHQIEYQVGKLAF